MVGGDRRRVSSSSISIANSNAESSTAMRGRRNRARGLAVSALRTAGLDLAAAPRSRCGQLLELAENGRRPTDRSGNIYQQLGDERWSARIGDGDQPLEPTLGWRI